MTRSDADISVIIEAFTSKPTGKKRYIIKKKCQTLYILFRFVSTLTINLMTRGFDELTLTFYETKICDHDNDNL